jgi:hypothetical protein
MMIWAIGAIRPPVIPCKIRNPMSEPAHQASPHSAEETMNAKTPEIK